ncbi:hypothetical protein [Alicyclobacillus macrosporangiidus]|uniref:hypothetical protein n=1 Tax=Alicyclobacillus macrosporangiidus TaxID=392015 RepID=UPI0004962F69|nr:hypothetical protein [Alicyclobacillus macrosporangiidus]
MPYIVDPKDRNLLIHSEAPKIADWFYKMLLDNEAITQEHAQDLSQEQRNFLQTMVGRIIQQANKEWYRDGFREIPDYDLGEERINCSICGQDNRYVYFIVNRLNGKKLNVGSTCINKFSIGVREGTTNAQLVREGLRLSRMNVLESKFTNILSLLETWEDRLEKYPILVKKELEEPYLEVGKRLKSIVEPYLSGKTKTFSAADIEQLLQVREAVLQRIEDYVQREMSRNSPFKATREVADWIRRNNPNPGYQWLKEDGEIRLRTAFRICEPKFMNSLVPQLNNALAGQNIVILQAELDRKGYVYILKRLPEVKLFVLHAILIRDHCGFILEDNENYPSVESIVEHSTIQREEKSIVNAANALQGYFDARRIPLRVIEPDLEYNELFIQLGSYVYQLPCIEFLNRFLVAIFGLRNIEMNEFVEQVERGKSMTHEEYRELRQERSRFGRRL